MTAISEKIQASEAEAAAEVRESRRKVFLRWFGTPLFLVAAGAALMTYAFTTELDRTAQRALDPERVIELTLEHLEISLLVALITVVLAVPTGIMCTRDWARRIRPFFIGLANIGQATPSLGLIALFVLTVFGVLFRSGYQAVVAGLVAYTFLPILRNTIAGIEAVDPALIESARGMGMNRRELLLKIELPLAVPVMLAGIRVALILAVGTTSLVYLFPGTTALGQVIQQGHGLGRTAVLIVGAGLVALLALLVDYVASIVEWLLRPRGL